MESNGFYGFHDVSSARACFDGSRNRAYDLRHNGVGAGLSILRTFEENDSAGFSVDKTTKTSLKCERKASISIMDSLPDDVLLDVFSFLSQEDLLKSALVCRTWKRLSRDSSLWSCLDLQPFAKSLREEDILRLIATLFAPLGKHLNLNDNVVTSAILQVLFERCCRLQSLCLNDCKFQSAGLWFELERSQLDSLKVLDLRNASGYASGVEDILRQSYNLEYLGESIS